MLIKITRPLFKWYRKGMNLRTFSLRNASSAPGGFLVSLIAVLFEV